MIIPTNVLYPRRLRPPHPHPTPTPTPPPHQRDHQLPQKPLIPTIPMPTHHPLRAQPDKQINHQPPHRPSLANLAIQNPRIVRRRHRIPFLRQRRDPIDDGVAQRLDAQLVGQGVEAQEREKRGGGGVDGFVLEAARVEPLHEVFEGVGAVVREGDVVVRAFEEGVGGVQGGGEVGGGVGEELAVQGEGGAGGADGEGYGGFEEGAGGGVFSG